MEPRDESVVVRTFLIADVRGYTRFTQTHGDEEAGKLAAKFAALAREGVTAMGGELIELRGDEALCAFGSARQALRAAVELQVRFRTRVDREPAFPLGIGIGLAAGEAVPIEGGYRGGALNLAARLCSVAAPGQIVASETVTSLAGRLDGVRFVELKATRLKGLEKPIRPIEVLSETPLPALPDAPAVPAGRRLLPLIVAGGVVVAAAVAAGLFLLGDGSNKAVNVGNAIAAVTGGGSVSYTAAGTTPSTVAAGEGAVWILNADDRTISKLDPETMQLRTFGIDGTPTDLAVGEGAVWVGLGAETGESLGTVYTASVARLDPSSTAPTGQPAALKAGFGDVQRIAGVSNLAAGAGALWAVNPEGSVARINATTGEVVTHIPVEAGGAIAAGREGVWVIGSSQGEIIEIDPKTNRAGERIELNVDQLWGLAVGAGSVWITDLVTGVLWRIEPRSTPRPIDVGFGVTSVAYGAGAIWVTNFVSDEVLRVDPRTNKVTERIALAGTPPSVAADADRAWVSVVGVPRGDVLPSSACGPVVSGGADPDVLIASDLPLQGPSRRTTRLGSEAIRFLLQQRGFRAGPHSVGYQSCDDSTAQTGSFDFLKCASNAKAYAAIDRVVGVVGPLHSPCAWAQIPVLNRADGPLAMISPANTHPGLTHKGPTSRAGEPDTYYPTGIRNYFRVTGSADVDGAAGAVLADELGLRRVYLLHSGGFGEETTTPFKQEAGRRSIDIVGSGEWDPETSDYRALSNQVAAARPDGVFIGGGLFENGGAVVRALRERLGRKVVLMAGDSFQPPAQTLEAAGPAAVGMYTTTTALSRQGLSARGRRFVREFARQHGVIPDALYVLETVAAADALLGAIARSDGTRESVIAELRTLDMDDGILAPFRFDANGDITPASFSVFRITGGQRRDPALTHDFTGAVVDRVVRVGERPTRP